MESNEAERARWNDDGWTRAWPKREVLTNSVTPLLMEALELQPGEQVLDIGCGGGNTTLAAADRVHPGGRVLGADISAALLNLARERAAGRDDVAFQQADMQIDRAGDGEFDVAMSQFGIMFFDEPVLAFTNIGHHLRMGGRLGFVCWQTLDRNPWFVGPAVAPFVPAPPPPAPGKSPTGPFALGDPDRVRQILMDAGFSDVTIVPGHHEVDVPESSVVDDAQLMFMGVSPDVMADARRAVDALMQRFETDGDQRRFPLAYQIVTARTG